MNIDELKKLAGLPVTEWANSPANTAHPEPEEVAAPEADVSQSLRRYLNADPQPVKVMESNEDDTGIIEHTVEDMMANFQKYLAEDELEEAKCEDDNCGCGKDPCESKEKADESIEEEAIEEKAKPDYIDIDGDGDKKEPMKKAVKDKKDGKEKADESVEAVEEEAVDEGHYGKKKKKDEAVEEEAVEESEDIVALRKLAGIGQTTTTQTVSEDVKALKKLAGI
tara:strand:- start:381 stop:1052 length:672 start_codon:yes stop_codon:yes gene_type:complete